MENPHISGDPFKVLFEQNAVGVAVTETQTGGFIRVNRKYSEIVGYSLEELYTMTFQEISHPDDLQQDVKKLQQLSQKKIDNYSIDKRFFHKNGNIVWVKLTVYPMSEFGEDDNSHLAILEDITERKLLEEDHAEKHCLLEAVIMRSPVPIIVVKAKGHELLYINSAALNVLGLSRGEMEKGIQSISSPLKLYQPDGTQYPLEKSVLFRALKGIVTTDREGIIERTDGEKRWVVGNGMPIYNDEGDIVAAINIFPDITEHKRSVEAIRESEKRYRRIMEASPDPIVQYDMQGNALYINPAFTKVFGWTSSEILGNKIPYVPEKAWPATNKMLNMLNRGENYSGFATRRLDKEGNEIDVVLSWSVWRDKEDNIAGSIVIIRDATKEVMLKKQLLQAQKMESIGNLAGGIAHDFNNILSPIIGYSQLLQQKFSLGEKPYSQAKAIFNAGMRASELVNQILTLSKKSDQEMVPVSLQNVVNEVLELCRSTILKNIDLRHDINEDCSPVMANPTQIHQILMNLITNAYHAVEKRNGSISVGLKQASKLKEIELEGASDSTEFAILTVSDTGVGIDAEIIEKIFDPYFTTKKVGKGTGLGLSIVYGIVKEHKGHIQVESQVGQGTTFTIHIPVLEKNIKNLFHDRSTALPTGNEHILLIDDEEELLNLEIDLLEKLGYKVSGFVNGSEALKEFKREPWRYDLVLTDLTMPSINGVQLAKEIFAIRQTIPILICTGFDKNISETDIRKAGVRIIIKKPIIFEKLAVLIREALDTH